MGHRAPPRGGTEMENAMTADFDNRDYSDPSPTPRYEILTVASDDPTDVIEWGATNDFTKAEDVYDLVKSHGEQHGVGKVYLWDRAEKVSHRSFVIGAF